MVLAKVLIFFPKVAPLNIGLGNVHIGFCYGPYKKERQPGVFSLWVNRTLEVPNSLVMYTRRNYGFFTTLNWSKKPLWVGLLYAVAVFAPVYWFDLSLEIPWEPISVIGIAVAFYLGFKNNSSYDRTWEARKIWGSIVNNSRTFGAATVAFVTGEKAADIQKELLYRHIAWMVALRYQLRQERSWEHTSHFMRQKMAAEVTENYRESLEAELRNYLLPQEQAAIGNTANAATQILKFQAQRLQQLRDQGNFDDFRHLEFHALIASFYDGQGKSERIKNFPFPRQYASTAFWLCLVFCALVPFGMLKVVKGYAELMIWLGPVLSAIIIWVFFLMEKIGDYSENPFEGTYNDVPITAIARSIEIDLREMIQDDHIPPALQPTDGFLM